jgi:hypothetical protein
MDNVNNVDYNINEIAINIKYNPDIHIVKNTYEDKQKEIQIKLIKEKNEEMKYRHSIKGN